MVLSQHVARVHPQYHVTTVLFEVAQLVGLLLRRKQALQCGVQGCIYGQHLMTRALPRSSTLLILQFSRTNGGAGSKSLGLERPGHQESVRSQHVGGELP